MFLAPGERSFIAANKLEASGPMRVTLLGIIVDNPGDCSESHKSNSGITSTLLLIMFGTVGMIFAASC